MAMAIIITIIIFFFISSSSSSSSSSYLHHHLLLLHLHHHHLSSVSIPTNNSNKQIQTNRQQKSKHLRKKPLFILSLPLICRFFSSLLYIFFIHCHIYSLFLSFVSNMYVHNFCISFLFVHLFPPYFIERNITLKIN